MATYHLSLKNGIVGTAKKHAEYILRLGRYSDKSRKEELKYDNANLPSWANDAVEFFEQADTYERVNGRAYVEFEIALPNELDLKDNINIIEEFIDNNIGKDRVWAYALHSKRAAFDDSQEQIHAHIMFSERIVTNAMEKALSPSKFFKRYNHKNPDRGGYQKDRRYSDKKCSIENIKKVRKDWEEITNAKYKNKKINKRISSESLEKQKEDAEKVFDYALATLLDRKPQEHLGPRVANIVKKTLKNKNINHNNLDDVLNEIYLISTKAFCLVIDQIEKEKKEIEYKKAMKQREQIMTNQIDAADFVCHKDNETIVVNGKDIMNIANNVEENLIDKVKACRAEINKMKNLLFSEKQIGFMALSICTRGRSKNLMKKRRMLDRRKKDYEEELTLLVNNRKPYFWQVEENRKYREQIEEKTNALIKVEIDLLKVRREAEQINELMKEEKNKKRMIVIINKLKERQKTRIEYIELLKNHEKLLLDVSIKYNLIMNEIDKESNYKLPKNLYRTVSAAQYDIEPNQIVKCLSEIECMMNNAEKENNKVARNTNNLKVNLDNPKGRKENQFEV